MQQLSQSVTTPVALKTLKNALGAINKLDAYQLSALVIEVDGEYHKLQSAKMALDVMNHIKSALKAKGFAVYCLHNAIWVVPFIHPDIVVPDFQRAMPALPTHRESLARHLQVESQPAVTTAKKRQTPWLAIAVAVLAIWSFVK